MTKVRWGSDGAKLFEGDKIMESFKEITRDVIHQALFNFFMLQKWIVVQNVFSVQTYLSYQEIIIYNVNVYEIIICNLLCLIAYF